MAQPRLRGHAEKLKQGNPANGFHLRVGCCLRLIDRRYNADSQSFTLVVGPAKSPTTSANSTTMDGQFRVSSLLASNTTTSSTNLGPGRLVDPAKIPAIVPPAPTSPSSTPHAAWVNNPSSTTGYSSSLQQLPKISQQHPNSDTIISDLDDLDILLNRVKRSEKAIRVERSHRENDLQRERSRWEREVRVLREALAPFYQSEKDMRRRLIEMEDKVEANHDELIRMEDRVKGNYDELIKMADKVKGNYIEQVDNGTDTTPPHARMNPSEELLMRCDSPESFPCPTPRSEASFPKSECTGMIDIELGCLAEPKNNPSNSSDRTPFWPTRPDNKAAIYDDLSNVDSDDVDGPGDGKETTGEDELAACFGVEPARAALAALQKVSVATPFDLLHAKTSFSQCPCGSSSGRGPDSSSPKGKSDLPNPVPTSSSSGSNKCKDPPGDDDDDGAEQNDKNKRDRASRKSRASPDAQTRWDCPFNRGPKVAAKSTCGSATSGLLLKDLWRHLMRDHFGCGKCKLKFQTDQAVKDHFYYRYEDSSVCALNLHGTSTPDLTYEQLRKMEQDYQKKNLNNSQKTWATWWELIRKDQYPGHAARNGVHQGTIAFPSAVFPAMMEEVWKALDGKVALDAQQRWEIETAVEENARLFSRSHEVWQRKSNGAGQAAPMEFAPGPVWTPALNGHTVDAMPSLSPNNEQPEGWF